MDELEKLAALVDRGWLTQAKLAEQKTRLLQNSGSVAQLKGRIDAVIAGGDARGAVRAEPARDGDGGPPWLSRRGTIRL